MATVKKTYVKKNTEESEVISGWYNEESMATELKWSKRFGLIFILLLNGFVHGASAIDMFPT